jgi:hypothetical protein
MTSMLGPENDAHYLVKSPSYHSDHLSDDQRSFGEMSDDESPFPPEPEMVFKTVVRRLNQHFLCHPFWSWCLDDEEDKKELLAATEKSQECADSVGSFQGSALEGWQRQRKEKRATIGLSYSDDGPDDEGEEGSQKSGTEGAVDLNSPKYETPVTITIAKVTTDDRYISMRDPTYKVEDDVASEVSLDFPEPNKGIKGQLIQIKKQPPKIIKTQKKKPKRVEKTTVNANEKDAKTNPDHGSKSKNMETKTKSNEKVSQDVNHDKAREESKIALSNQDTTEKSNVQNTTEVIPDVCFDPPPVLGAFIKLPSEAEGQQKESNSTQTVGKNTTLAPSCDPTKEKTPETRETVKVDTNRTLEPQSQVVDDDLELSSILPLPRFIPDFSRRELKLRPTTSPPERLRWKYAEDSRWEYYGDPRRNRIDHWWKEESRHENSNNANQPQQDRDMPLSEERYQCDSDSEDGSYLNNHAPGPPFESPRERAEQLTRERSKSQKSSLFQLFGFGARPSEAVRGTRWDEFVDFVDLNDLGRPRRSRYETSHGVHDESRDPAEFELDPSDPSMYNTTNMAPVPPGVFHL